MTQIIPAAQYIRMSTEHQRYSPLTQAAAIKKYADEHGFKIVADYRDHGKSGVTLRGRDGLKQLLADVIGGDVSFQAVLVLDVSRWGRFQDPDQAAHYEFLCREAGVEIRYCSEQFENDGSATSSLVKHFKRVIAGEYSRELGTKTLAGAITSTRLGFKQGGTAPYGLRRMLVDPAGRHVMLLSFEERRGRAGDKVIYVHGPADEIETIRLIYRLYITKEMTIPQVEKELKFRGVLDDVHKRFTRHRIIRILSSEIYAGYYHYNRTTQRLHSVPTPNDPEAWVRCRMLEPIVSERLFARARARLQSRRQDYLKTRTRREYQREELLIHLRQLLAQHGRLSYDLVNSSPGPSTGPYYVHFGGLVNAYGLIGYKDFIARRKKEAYTPEKLIEGLQQILRRNGYLCAELIDDDPSVPGRTVYQRVFGSLAVAYRTAGWEVDPKRLHILGLRRRLQALREIEAAKQQVDVAAQKAFGW